MGVGLKGVGGQLLSNRCGKKMGVIDATKGRWVFEWLSALAVGVRSVVLQQT